MKLPDPFDGILTLHSSASLFTSARISNINGGTYLNVLGNYIVAAETKYLGENINTLTVKEPWYLTALDIKNKVEPYRVSSQARVLYVLAQNIWFLN